MLPSRPGWYPNPLDRATLRYWDGREWSGRSRPAPPWTSALVDFEVPSSSDRAVEGPVHPRELREPVTSGASWREGPGRWKGRQVQRPWQRPSVLADDQGSAPSNFPSAKFASARRPLLMFVAMVVVAAAIVISSVAVMSPYDRGAAPSYSTPSVDLTFAHAAAVDCAAVLPAYGSDLLPGLSGPRSLGLLGPALRQFVALSSRISHLRPVGAAAANSVDVWLGSWSDLARDDSSYAKLFSPAESSSSQEQASAQGLRKLVLQDAQTANEAVARMGVKACELPLAPAA